MKALVTRIDDLVEFEGEVIALGDEVPFTWSPTDRDGMAIVIRMTDQTSGHKLDFLAVVRTGTAVAISVAGLQAGDVARVVGMASVLLRWPGVLPAEIALIPRPTTIELVRRALRPLTATNNRTEAPDA